MGLDVTTYVVYGVAMERDEISLSKKHRGCKHTTDENANFCSECGKPVWVEQKEPLVDNLPYKDTPGFFSSSSDAKKGILGFPLSETDSHRIRITDYLEVTDPLDENKRDLLAFLKAHNFPYTEADFKTYCVTYFSY